MSTVVPPPPAARKAPPPAARAPQQPETLSASRFAISRGKIKGAQRIMLYGPGGIGKTSLAALAPNPVFIDLEDGSKDLDVARVEWGETWADFRACLQSSALDSYQSIVIDSVTKAESLAIAHTLATVLHPDKGYRVDSIEGYGFGKGLQFVFETFTRVLPDLDRHIRAGRNIILIAHDCVNDVPNPNGEDFIRYEPHLQSPKSGKSSIREAVFQWVDHALFMGYDVVVGKDGKGKGGGTRTIWSAELPSHRAKSRSMAESIPYETADDGTIWQMIFGGEK